MKKNLNIFGIILLITLFLSGCAQQSTIPENWTVYRNTEQNYSVQHPNHWEINQDQTPVGKGIGMSAKEIVNMPDDYSGIAIVVNNVSLENLIEQYEYVDPLYKEQNPEYIGPQITEQISYVLDGVQGTKLTGTSDDGSGVNIIFVEKDGNSYIIYFNDYNATHTEIIPSFKFNK